jgi:DNA-binding protein HU-beta
MHRTDFVRAVARETGMSQAEVARVLETSFDLIARALARGEAVVLTGFGTFEMRTRAARRGVSPRTGAPITIDATTNAGFTASHRLKALIDSHRQAAPAGDG